MFTSSVSGFDDPYFSHGDAGAPSVDSDNSRKTYEKNDSNNNSLDHQSITSLYYCYGFTD